MKQTQRQTVLHAVSHLACRTAFSFLLRTKSMTKLAQMLLDVSVPRQVTLVSLSSIFFFTVLIDYVIRLEEVFSKVLNASGIMRNSVSFSSFVCIYIAKTLGNLVTAL